MFPRNTHIRIGSPRPTLENINKKKISSSFESKVCDIEFIYAPK